MRIGHGYDVHKVKKGRKCILCGVEIPHESGPDGHSDADVPVHALMDALLGAAALGDIGKHFPPSDTKYKNADSMKLLRKVNLLINKHGYVVGNIDITIVLEEPKLADYIIKMRDSVANAVCTGIENVSIKATTEEGLGFTGEKAGISSTAVVLLNRE